jgi:hypothetical protein
MDDKELPVTEGQAEESAPTEEAAPEVADENESPVEETDKDLTDWATNKGFNPDDLADEKLAKAIKMAKNAESMAGKATQKQSEPEDEDLDKYLDSLLADESPSTDAPTLAEDISKIDVSKLTPQEQSVLKQIQDGAATAAEKKAMAAIAPLQAQLRKQQYRAEYKRLHKEYGDDFAKKSPEIFQKMQGGASMEDAAFLVLGKDLIKKSRSQGIETGKKTEQQTIRQTTQEVKKTVMPKVTVDDLKDLPIEEHQRILEGLQKRG